MQLKTRINAFNEQKIKLNWKKKIIKLAKEIDTDSTPFSPESNLFHTDSKQLENRRVISIIDVIDSTIHSDAIV